MTVYDREIAAERMRKEADGYRNNERMYGHVSRIDTGEVPALFQDITTFVGLRGYIRSDAMFDTLADLIDPTCHLIGTTLQTWTDGTHAFYHELSCGHTCETVWAKPPAYCTECGARLVDDDG